MSVKHDSEESVNVRDIHTCEEFLMSLLEPNWQQLPGSKISTDWEMLWKMAV